jgi:hypothetical protein
MENITKILPAPKYMCRKFFYFTGKIVCMKFPGYTENRIFSVFADGRIKPWFCQFMLYLGIPW